MKTILTLEDPVIYCAKMGYDMVERLLGRSFAETFARKPALALIEQRCDELEELKLYYSATEGLQILCKWEPQNPYKFYRWGRLLLNINKRPEALEKLLIANSLSNNFTQDSRNLLININLKIGQLKRVDPFEVLPTELINIIFLHLGIWERTRLRHISKLWYRYLTSDKNFWNDLFVMSPLKSNRPISLIIEKFLQNAGRANINHKVSIFVADFSHTIMQYKPQPMHSLMKANFAKQDFKNVCVATLKITISLPSSFFHKRFFLELISVKFLEIRIYRLRNESCPINFESILIGQKKLEALLFESSCEIHMPACNMTKGVQCFALKKVNIITCDDLALITNYCIMACPNMEDLALRGRCSSTEQHKPILDVDKLNKRITKSKLKSFSLYGGLSTFANYFNESNVLFPNCLESLTLAVPSSVISSVQGSEAHFRLSQENLGNLQTLILNRYIDVSKLLRRFNIGKILKQLHICSSLNGMSCLDPMLFQYTKLEVLGLCGNGEYFDDRISNFILDHFPKLGRLYLHHYQWDWEALDHLLERRDLKIIVWDACKSMHSRFNCRGITCEESSHFFLCRYFW